MKKKVISFLLMFVLAISFCLPAMAATPRATDYVDVRTSGGTAGYTTVRFRVTCVQDSIPTNYSWSSSMTLPSGIQGFSYYQSGAVTLSNHTQDPFTVYSGSYSKSYTNALVGGRAYMKASSGVFGNASKEMSVTR